MIILEIREATQKDNYLYDKCFNDSEFSCLFSENYINVSIYTSVGYPNKRFIISQKLNEKTEDIGFCHFVFQERGEYFFSGGCIPELFNSGKGLLACVFAIFNMFTYHGCCVINTIVLKRNNRSFRMLNAIGFDIIKEEKTFYILKLRKKEFNNYLVKHICSKLGCDLNKL